MLALLEIVIMSEFEKVVVESASEDSGSESLGDKTHSFDLNHDPPETKPPLILKLKFIMLEVVILLGKTLFRISLIARKLYQ